MMSLPLYCVFSLFNTCLKFPNSFFRFPLKILKFRNNIAKIAISLRNPGLKNRQNFAIILRKFTIELRNIPVKKKLLEFHYNIAKISQYYRRCYIRDNIAKS